MSETNEQVNSDNLRGHEIFWRDHCKWLEEKGYILRRRYQPDWTPSWKGTKKDPLQCEDGLRPTFGRLMDAQRKSDGSFVMMKLVKKASHPFEADIGRLFSSEPLASDPKNHCVPFYDVLSIPDDDTLIVFVMPLLREHDDPRFDTIGEAVEFFQQMFEGVQFMHRHHVAHRDCTFGNIMMDALPMYPVPYHPASIDQRRDFPGRVKHLTRTQAPVKYYLVDFGLSRQYNPDDGPPLEPPIFGGDRTVPEFQNSIQPCNPFPTDVYYLGNMIRENFTEGHRYASARLGFDFMKPLVEQMMQEDPTKRPTMDQVVEQFNTIRQGLSACKLRSRVVKKNDSSFIGFFRSLAHWGRRITFIVRRIPAIPSPTYNNTLSS